MSLIVTGSIGIDTVMTPTGRADDVLGGSTTYFAAAASFFGPVRLVGAVGEDFPTRFLDDLRHFHIDLAGLEVRRGSKTFRWTGRYRQNLNERDTLDVQLNVLAERLPPVPDQYRDSQFVFLANTHPAGQLELLASFPVRQLAVADTMDLWIRTERAQLLKLLQQIDGLVLNDSEAVMLTGESNMIRAAQAVLALGPRFVVIKRGEHGCLIHHREGAVILPAFPTAHVVDPTGAGDSFAGGFMGHLAATSDKSLANLKHALAYGTVMASFNIEAFSLQRLHTITRRDVDERCREFIKMLQFA